MIMSTGTRRRIIGEAVIMKANQFLLAATLAATLASEIGAPIETLAKRGLHTPTVPRRLP
jgi:hypothetical protein